MTGTPMEPGRRPARRDADDHALAYPEPAPHPLWSRQARPRYSPLTRAQQQHNQELLLLGLRTDHNHRTPAEAS